MIIWRSQPFLIVISLIVVSLMYSIIIYYFISRFWFRYILLLVILTGVLVLFSYISRIIPNESFEIIKLVYLSVLFLIICLFFFKIEFFYIEDDRIKSTNLWEISISLFNLYLIFFLFIIIVMVVWLVKLKRGAVRNL